jgi:hypothetical protein
MVLLEIRVLQELEQRVAILELLDSLEMQAAMVLQEPLVLQELVVQTDRVQLLVVQEIQEALLQ